MNLKVDSLLSFHVKSNYFPLCYSSKLVLKFLWEILNCCCFSISVYGVDSTAFSEAVIGVNFGPYNRSNSNIFICFISTKNTFKKRCPSSFLWISSKVDLKSIWEFLWMTFAVPHQFTHRFTHDSPCHMNRWHHSADSALHPVMSRPLFKAWHSCTWGHMTLLPSLHSSDHKVHCSFTIYGP